jgi:protein-L-isoaspartate O-methyltransferase
MVLELSVFLSYYLIGDNIEVVMETTFNEKSSEYSEVRPGYPNEIYERVRSFKRFDRSSELLEIGSGHGVATREVHSHWNSNITAIEPGESLFKLSKENFKDFNKIEFINTKYEKFQRDKKYDGIYAATAFHWIDPKYKYLITNDLLKEDGIFFAFWNYFSIKDEVVFYHIQDIYENFHPLGAGDKDVRILMRNKINNRKNEIKSNKYFKLIDHFEINNPIEYTAKQYIKLLKTFPNNNLQLDLISPFYNEIEKYIYSIKNSIELDIIVSLDIACKQ